MHGIAPRLLLGDELAQGTRLTAKVPGYFGAWARKYRWKERAAVWGSHFGGLVVSRNAEQLEAARQPIRPNGQPT